MRAASRSAAIESAKLTQNHAKTTGSGQIFPENGRLEGASLLASQTANWLCSLADKRRFDAHARLKLREAPRVGSACNALSIESGPQGRYGTLRAHQQTPRHFSATSAPRSPFHVHKILSANASQ